MDAKNKNNRSVFQWITIAVVKALRSIPNVKTITIQIKPKQPNRVAKRGVPPSHNPPRNQSRVLFLLFASM